METKALLITAERLKQGLLAKATDGDYEDKQYKADLAELMTDQRIAKMIPTIIQVNRTSADFRRAMQAHSPHYAGRRQYINEQLSPIFEYLHSVESGTDSFTDVITKNDLGENLGRGGFGAVRKYHHKLLDMDFALKLFEPIFVSNEENIEGEKRFFREAKILFSLNHENIVRIICSEKCDWQSALTEINALLREDGYEIYASEKISGKDVYSYRYCI